MKGGVLISLLCIAIAFSAMAEDLPYYVDADLGPKWIDDAEVQPGKLHQIAPFALLNQFGKPVTEKDFDGKVWIVNFIFTTCPGLCRTLSAHMKSVQNRLESSAGLKFVSISVMPETDTPEKLLEYSKRYDADKERWSFLTGDKDAVYELARKSFFADSGPRFERGQEDFLHTETFYLIDQHRHIRGVYSGMKEADLLQLVEDAQSLQAWK